MLQKRTQLQFWMKMALSPEAEAQARTPGAHFMVENISASYFKMPGIWTLYSINLINHEPPWRRVDHTVMFLRQ